MTNKNIYRSLNFLDPELIINAAPAERTKKKKTITWFKIGTIAAAFLILIMGSVMIRLFYNNASQAGGTNGKINTRDKITITGKQYAFSDEEAIHYLNQVKNGIINTLTVSGIDASQLEIKENGYSHIRTENNGNEMAMNWRDYLAYNGEKLIAIIQVTKDKTGIKHHLSFGGTWFSRYEDFLRQYKGTELVYIYIGDVEAFIDPDNQVIPLIDTDISSTLDENQQYYQYFKTECNVYIP